MQFLPQLGTAHRRAMSRYDKFRFERGESLHGELRLTPVGIEGDGRTVQLCALRDRGKRRFLICRYERVAGDDRAVDVAPE